MTQNTISPADEDLTPHFRWRWHEHGIYLGVCGALGLFVAVLQIIHMTGKRPFDPTAVELIQVRYIATADQAPEGPFHDPRLLQPARRAHAQPIRRAM